MHLPHTNTHTYSSYAPSALHSATDIKLKYPRIIKEWQRIISGPVTPFPGFRILLIAANTGKNTEYVKYGRMRWARLVARMRKGFDWASLMYWNIWNSQE